MPDGPLTGTGPFIKGGPGTMTIQSSSDDYTGGTVINGGTMIVSDPATLGVGGPLTMAVGTVLNYSSSTDMTNSPVDATGAAILNNNSSTTITLSQTAGNHGLGGVGGVSGATTVFAGDPAAVTTITGSAGVGLGVAGMTAIFTGGTWYNANNGQQPVNVEIDGGNLILPAGAINSQWLIANQTLTIHGGSLVSSNAYGHPARQYFRRQPRQSRHWAVYRRAGWRFGLERFRRRPAMGQYHMSAASTTP